MQSNYYVCSAVPFVPLPAAVPDEVQHVAITCEDDTVRIMQFVLNNHRGLTQVATPETVAAEIARTAQNKVAFPSPPKRWRFVELADLPQSLDDRGQNWKKWRDDGKTIKVQG